jgi:hypothetical protein
MAVVFSIKKDPYEQLAYTMDWSKWLIPGDSISTSSWVLDTGISGTTSSNGTATTTVVIFGGTNGNTYLVSNRIVTANNLKSERSINFIVEQR